MQLKELSHLILGIRVFNWDIGKGGAGITDIPRAVADTCADLERRLQAQVDNSAEACEQYADVLVAPAAAIGPVAGDTDAGALQARWRAELANRRQLAAFLSTISDDLREDKQQFDAALASFRCVSCAALRGAACWPVHRAPGGRLELDDVKRLVAGRSSVPKEQVYPKFHAMALQWLLMQDIRDKVLSRKAVHAAIAPFVPPSVCTLHLDTVKRVRMYRIPHAAGGDKEASDAKSSDAVSDEPSVASVGDDAPVRLSLEASPDFMQLPLEFQVRPLHLLHCLGVNIAASYGFLPAYGLQGYCSHTLVNKNGLLIPGDPAQGVVRYQGKFYVFANERGIVDFIANPQRYTQGMCCRLVSDCPCVRQAKCVRRRAFCCQAVARACAPVAIASLLSPGFNCWHFTWCARGQPGWPCQRRSVGSIFESEWLERLRRRSGPWRNT